MRHGDKRHAVMARLLVVASRPFHATARPSSMVDDFLRRPSIGLAARILLLRDVRPDDGWTVFCRVIDCRLGPRAPFFQRMMEFCKRALPSKAPDVMRAAVCNGIPVRRDETLFMTFLAACKLANPPAMKEAIDLYRQCGPRSRNVINNLAVMCRASKHPESVMFLLSDAIDNNVQVDAPLFSMFAAACAEEERLSLSAGDAAERLLGLVLSKGVAMPNIRAHDLASLMQVLLRQDRFDAAIKAFQLTNALDRPPSKQMCTVLVTELTRGECVPEAMAVADLMSGRGVPFTEGALTSLVVVCGSHGAFASLQKLHEYASGGHALSKNVGVINAFIAAYGRCCHPNEAYKVFRSVAMPDPSTYEAMITAFVRNGMADRADEVLDEFESTTGAVTREALGNIISAFAEADLVASAMRLFVELVERDLRAGTAELVCLVSACGRNRDLDTLHKLRQFAKQNGLLSGEPVASAFVSAYHQCHGSTPSRDAPAFVRDQEVP